MKTLQKVLDRNIPDLQKLAIIKNIFLKQMYPQISKYLMMEFNELGIVQRDKSDDKQQQLLEMMT